MRKIKIELISFIKEFESYMVQNIKQTQSVFVKINSQSNEYYNNLIDNLEDCNQYNCQLQETNQDLKNAVKLDIQHMRSIEDKYQSYYAPQTYLELEQRFLQ